MFGINSTEQIKQIAEGWTNDLLGREQELSDKRMKICKECPIYDENADRCDSKKCLNKETGEITQYPGKATVCGCGCYMKKKTRVPSSHCVLNKW